MGLVASYYHPIVGNTTSFESKKWWQVAGWLPGAMKKMGVEKWKKGVVVSLWSQNRWLEDDNFPFERCLLVKCYVTFREGKFFSSRPKNCRKPFKEGGVVQKLREICGVCGGANVAAHGFFSHFLAKDFFVFLQKTVICTNPPQLMTSFTKTTPLCGTFFWRRVELSPGSVFVLENVDRHGGLILKIPCKAPELWFKKRESTNPGLPLAMRGKKHLKISSFFFTQKKTHFENDWNVMTTFLYIKSQLF